jgi:hypothetical protein
VKVNAHTACRNAAVYHFFSLVLVLVLLLLLLRQTRFGCSGSRAGKPAAAGRGVNSHGRKTHHKELAEPHRSVGMRVPAAASPPRPAYGEATDNTLA